MRVPRSPSLPRRSLPLLLLALLLGGIAAVSGGAARAQEGPANQIHYPLNDEMEGILAAADAARLAQDYGRAIELYRAVLDKDDPKSFQIAHHPDRDGRRFIGVSEWAIRGLRALPAKGAKLFRARYDYRAGSALDAALETRDPYRALARAYDLFPISSYAAQTLQTMAELALERGQLHRAQRVLRRLLAHHQDELPSPAAVHHKLLLCAIGLGRPEEVQRIALALRRDDPDGELHLAGEPVALEELIARTLKLEAIRDGRTRDARCTIPLVRGDTRNRAQFSAPAAFGGPRFAPRAFDAPGPVRGLDRLGPGAFRPESGVQARVLPVVHDGRAFVVTADSIHAYDIASGDQVRRIRRPPHRPLFEDPNGKVQFGGAISQGLLVAPLVEEVLRDQSFRGIPIKVQIPLRKLAGFDVDPERWSWQWDHALALRGTRLERWSFPCPPVAQEGVVYASAFAIEGFVDSHVAAFDGRTGEPLWTTWVSSGQVEQTMFGEQATEPLCVPVAVADGAVYHVTSFGSVAALDADTGRPLWVSEYDQVEVRAPKGYYADHRPIVWENNAPLVEDGVVVVTPLDSNHAYGFDAETGRRVWQAPARLGDNNQVDMRYVIGADDGKVVLAGGHEVRCYDVRGGKLLWRTQLRGRVVAGRGLIAAGEACIPVDNNKLITVDLDTGDRSGIHDLSATGNLLLCGDALLVAGSGQLGVHKNGDHPAGRSFK